MSNSRSRQRPFHPNSFLLAFLLTKTVIATTVSANFTLVSPNNTCPNAAVDEINDAAFSSTRDLAGCKHVCAQTSQCVAIGLWKDGMCIAFSKFCDTPQSSNQHIQVYRKVPNSTVIITSTSSTTKKTTKSSPRTLRVTTTTTTALRTAGDSAPTTTTTGPDSWLTPILILTIVVFVVVLITIIVVIAILIRIASLNAKKTQTPYSHKESFSPEYQVKPDLPTKQDRTRDSLNPIMKALGERTFATSHYKHVYAEARPAAFQHQLLTAVHKTLKLVAMRMNPTVNPDILAGRVDDFMSKIQDEAFRNDKALKDDVGAVAEYLWTSGKKHLVVKGMEMCSVLNTVIRDDILEEVVAAGSIFRSINTRRVQRDGDAKQDQPFPDNCETWRGGGFRRRFRAFFNRLLGQKYRVPAFLATSNKMSVAATFANKVKNHPRVIWCIKFDPRGEAQVKFRVKHMTFVEKSLIANEGEYLFAPYSVFTLQSVEWSEVQEIPHKLTIVAALDNKQEDENLPLTPWY